VLKALGSPDLPSSLPALTLWQQLLRRAGCELSQVNAAWENELSVSDRELQAELAQVPVLRGGAAHYGGDSVKLLAQAEGEPSAGMRFVARVRTKSTGDEASGTPIRGTRGADGTLEFQVPTSAVVDGALQFQLTLNFERQGIPVNFANEWTKARVSP
jgi:hypothetical protein